MLNEGLPPNRAGSQAPGTSTAGSSGTAGAGNSGSHKSAIRKALDEASSTLTSPFSEAFGHSSSEWAKRGVQLLLALVVYGFGLGFLARMIRVRA